MASKNDSSGQRKISIIILFIVIIVALFLALINFITDWVWFKEMGYVSVFFTQLFTQLKVGIPVFVVLTGLVLLYLNGLKKGYFKKIASRENTDMSALNKYTRILAVVFGLVVAYLSVSNLWFQILQFANATDFDISDPLFNLDISFYIFKLDFLKQLNELVIGVIVAAVILTIVYYIILITMHTPDILKEEEPAEPIGDDERYSGSNNPFGGNMGGDSPFGKIYEQFTGKKPPERKPRKQIDDNNFKQLMSIASGAISVMGVVFFLMVGVDFFLRQFDLLHAHTGAVYGAGFTDVNITLWMYRALCVLSVLGAITIVHHIRKKQFKKILLVPVIMIGVGLLGMGGSFLVQNFIVSPDEISKESEYLERNIEYTQYAYNLDEVTRKSFAADNALTAADIKNNPETISNIRINDYQPVKTFYNQTQSIRQYYQFNDVDVDRYMINGEYTQTYLAAREIDEAKLSESSKTWLNMHIKYTHGYGITLSRVDSVTSSGQPDVLIKNIPPESRVDEIASINRSEIYFGELTNDYILVNTDEDEFDYPDGDSNKYAQYQGKAGIKMNFLNRIMFAIREGSLKLLVSSNITGDSKIVIHRNVIDRVKTIMPYLSYEEDPYIVTVDGKLYWMMDAYTTSSYYPYAEPFDGKIGGTNYIRNSVKVVVDAYNGDVSFYIVDEDDPMAMTMQKIYPKLFKSADQMPEGLKSHIRYPNTLFQIQANIYSRYHMEDVKVFYQNEDSWDIANEIYGKEQQAMTPNYYIVKLPGEKSAEFISSIPYTPRSKQNMTALLVARNDGEEYGNLVLYQFPKNKTVYGPMQIEAQIDQNTQISQDFSLWSSSGSSYSRGNIFVIPIETSLLYVEPVYLEASNQAIPEVKRVIVAYDDQIAYEATLGEALESLFGEGAAGTSTPSIGDQSVSQSAGMSQTELIAQAVEAYNKAETAQKSGDWASYGEYISQLENYLNRLQSNQAQ
ncbi:MAG TPA: UPF0182 family protein [Anaerovoracaceae bacterium]|nr:UPF0182 family protein [Anaerovoracaceae bacterium]